ncbi:hypothetical protein [Campylobacter gastrosuis]|uniref:Uncharacterized protein n=1 Tax=Campylobacter gastrosuis TaxID=2974576 RepID=A0ABT7HQN8_9BACT|nr:hypothetical protein [Campylobacter gastrosuis]MDL0089219.1 hypothetical protein [Campylobacter gastrosuis]
MDCLTKKERMELEAVFAVIYRKKESKFLRFYKEFYALTLLNFKSIRKKIRQKRR